MVSAPMPRRVRAGIERRRSSTAILVDTAQRYLATRAARLPGSWHRRASAAFRCRVGLLLTKCDRPFGPPADQDLGGSPGAHSQPGPSTGVRCSRATCGPRGAVPSRPMARVRSGRCPPHEGSRCEADLRNRVDLEVHPRVDVRIRSHQDVSMKLDVYANVRADGDERRGHRPPGWLLSTSVPGPGHRDSFTAVRLLLYFQLEGRADCRRAGLWPAEICRGDRI